MKEEMISVIIPVYNAQKYLKRCIDSILQQSYQNLEILLINDGSTDDSKMICDRYAAEDIRVSVKSIDNSGQGMARNIGLEAAHGVYISFVDADDYLEPDCYEKCIGEMQKYGADLCAFAYQKQDIDGKVFYIAPVRKACYKGKDIAGKFVLHFFGDSPDDDDLRGVAACMSIYRREIIEEGNVRFRSERKVLSEDTLFNLDVCRYVKTAVTMETPFYHYCQNAVSFSKRYRQDLLQQTEQFVLMLSQYADYYKIQALVAERIRMLTWLSVMTCIRQEISRTGDAGLGSVVKHTAELIRLPFVEKCVNEIDARKMNMKQKLLLNAVKNKNAFWVVLLGYIKAKSENLG